MLHKIADSTWHVCRFGSLFAQALFFGSDIGVIFPLMQ